MADMQASTLKAILSASKADALASQQSSQLSSDRTDAMDYYNGKMTKDMPAAPGRSSAVSTDTADTIEGLMPALMEIFCGADDEVVEFSPVGPDDVEPAQQETDYVNHVFMQKNPGFLVLYSFIKDALLSKVGIVKIWQEEGEEEKRETYFDQPDDAFAMLVGNPDVEVIEHTAHPDPMAPPPQPGMEGEQQPMLHDVTVVTKRTYSCTRVEPVPPEEFGIERRAKRISITDPSKCNYCFHETLSTQDDLIDQGYDKKQVKALPSYPNTGKTEDYARDTVEERNQSGGDESLNEAIRPIKVTEHYIRMDYRGDGKPALFKVMTGGEDCEVLTRSGKEDVEQVDYMPFAAMTPVIVTHRFFGRSIADLVKDIQQIKTALLRGALDNLYMHNNPRVEVAESHAGDSTLDDLLVARPMGIVRTKMPGGLNWQEIPDITASVYPALEYMDGRLEQRTGVSKQGQGLDANALQNQSATAVAQAFSASQARMRLIARIFAETGIRDLFALLHATIRKYGQKAETVRLRNKWVPVDPRQWKERNDMTINVGLGTGSKAQQFSHIMAIINLQSQAIAAGKTNVVSDANLYNSGKFATNLLGHKDVNAFFTDPSTVPPPQTPPDPKLMLEQMKAQHDQQSAQMKLQGDQQIAGVKAQLEQQKMQADLQHQGAKNQAEANLAQAKFEMERDLKVLEANLKVQQAEREHEYKQQELAMNERIANKKIQFSTNAKKADASATMTEDGNAELHPDLAKAIGHLTEMAQKTHQAVLAPRRSDIHRDPKTNKITHATHKVTQ